MPRLNNESNFPAVPASFFTSLSSEQQKQLTTLLYRYRLYYAKHYNYSGELLRKNGYLFVMWEFYLFRTVIFPTKMTKNMFVVLCIIDGIHKSDKYKNVPITQKLVHEITLYSKGMYRLYPEKNMKYLEKYDWINSQRKNRSKMYYITDKGRHLLNIFSLRYAELNNNFFADSFI